MVGPYARFLHCATSSTLEENGKKSIKLLVFLVAKFAAAAVDDSSTQH